VTHLDALGRAFLSVEHNRFKYSDTAAADPPIEAYYASRVVLDITGDQREVIDSRDRIVMRYRYDLLGVRVRQSSMEAGERWLFTDVTGKPIRAWDSRGHQFRTGYDRLRRPLRIFVRGADPAQSNQELLTERLVYGEQHPEGELRNLRGALFLHLDQAGALVTQMRDFKGNISRSSRRLAQEYRQAIDWSAVDVATPIDPVALLDLPGLAAALDPRLEAETFESETMLDALNRPIRLIAPHAIGRPASIIRPRYNEANLLDYLDVNLRGENGNGPLIWTPFVTNIDYNAHGRRMLIQYGNGAETRYRYDPDTFRLTHLYTRRGSAFTDDCDNVQQPPDRVSAPPEPPDTVPCGLQNLHYAYDPSGNITHVRDNSQQVVFFRNRRVEPSADYTTMRCTG
jgi:hypothetical protein